MEILRNIEKNIINISNNDKYDANDTQLLKNNIKEYLTYINDKENIINEKKIKYNELYENPRIKQELEYSKYLNDKRELLNIFEQEKTKSALYNYLNLKRPKYNDINLYSYENINLIEKRKIDNVLIRKDIIKPPIKKMKPAKVCPDGKEINPLTGNCVKKCKDDELRDLETGKCKKLKKEPKKGIKKKAKGDAKSDAKGDAKSDADADANVKVKKGDGEGEVVDVGDVGDKCSEKKIKECDKIGKKCNPKTGRCIKK